MVVWGNISLLCLVSKATPSSADRAAQKDLKTGTVSRWRRLNGSRVHLVLIHACACVVRVNQPLLTRNLTRAVTWPLQLTDIDVVGSSSAGLDVLLQPSGAPAFLPSFHLSDFPSHWQPLLDMRGPPPGEVRTPRRLTDALYYGRNKDKSHVSIVTSVMLSKGPVFQSPILG